MKTYPATLTALFASCLLAVFALAAPAAIVQSVVNGAGNTVLDMAITNNLIRNGQSSLAGVTTTHESWGYPTFTTPGLNDGSAAGNVNKTVYFVSDGSLPVTITFNLNTNSGTGGSATGYDISSIQALTGWTDSYFADHQFQLLLSLNGGSFSNYGTFKATTAINGGGNSLLDTLTGSSGPIASGVTAIRFVFSDAGGTHGTVVHELQAFGTPTPASSPPARYRIVTVGDSITAGYTDNPNWTVPFQYGYRSGLMTRLVNNGMSFQFVGNSPEPWNAAFGTVANLPNPDLRTAGQDRHEGYGGQGTAFVLGNMNAWLAADQPDILLLMIGINDIASGSTAEPTAAEQNLNNIVATVVSQRPNTRLIVAQITPYSSYTDAITKYNNYIKNTLVPYYAGQGKYVTTVNQYTNLCVSGTTNIDATLFSNGINHPNAVAYDRMAQTWWNGIQALSLPPAQPPPAGANLLVNGGFEVPSFGNNTHNVNPTAYGWSYTAGVSGAGSGIDRGDPYGGSGSIEFEGAQQGCLQSSGNSTVMSISQTVANLTVGQYYQVSFASKAITGFSGTNPFKVGIVNGATTNLLFGGSLVWPNSAGYTYYTSEPFQASNSVMTLTFFDQGLSSAGYVSWIDGVSLYAIPTPAVVQTPLAGASKTACDGAIAVNLVRAGQSSLGSVSASHGPSIPAAFATTGLNDGNAAANGNLTYYGNADPTGGNLPVTITFSLNTNSASGGSPMGYIVNSIQAISGWSDSFLAHQSFQLLLSLNGGAYADYGTYNAFNYLNGGNNSILQTLTAGSGPIASGVTGVRFIFQNPGGIQGGSGGTVLHELQVFGAGVPVPVLLTDTQPATALNVIGDQVIITAAFSNSPPVNLQWQKIAGGVTNDISGANSAMLTLNNLQLADAGAYRLRAVNATNSSYITYSTPGVLTISSVPAPVNNVITKLAAQTGLGPADALGISFTPTWPLATANSLIAGLFPSSTNGNFSLEVPGRNVSSLTAGGSQALSIVTATVGYTTSTNYVTCGNGYGAGSSLIYTLTGSANGYDLTNITVYGGWGDAGRDQQAYTVSYATVVAPSNFIPLAIVNYNPTNPANVESAVRATLLPAAGALAANVAAVKFDFTYPASENGYCGYSQIAVSGTPSGPPLAVIAHLPKPMQVYPRNLATGYANVLVDGSVINTDCTQVTVAVSRNGVAYTNLVQSLSFANGTAPFSITVPIFAELASYDFQVIVTHNGTDSVVASVSDVVAGDVYVINGQSNAEAQMFAGSVNGNTNRYLRSFGTRDDSGATVNADLNWHLADGDLLYAPGAVGQWGLRLGRRIIDTYGVPVAIINGARGGWPITSFQRNDANREDLGTDYGRTLFRIEQAGAKNSVRAVLWYQGESDNGDADAHDKGWTTLHDNWRQDFPSIEKFYVFQLHVGCGVNQFDADLRNRQRLFADRFNDVEVMSTTAVGNTAGNCHYPCLGGYETLAEHLFRLIQRDLYGAAPQNNIEPPNPYYAYFSTPAHDQITLVMRNANDTLGFTPGAEADFQLSGSAVTVTAGVAVSNTLVLTLSGDASGASGLIYGGHIGASAPAITNANGVGLLAFYNQPIQPGLGAPGVPTGVGSTAISSSRVDIVWTAAANAAAYLISRNGVTIGQTSGTVFTDTAVTSGVPYSYQVAAVSLVSTSAWSTATIATTVPDNVFAFVPESTNFTVLYRLDIPNDLRLGSSLVAPYAVDNSSSVTNSFDRLAYYLELQTNPGQPLSWVYVSSDPVSSNPRLLGVPSVASGAVFHQPITNLNVYASAGSSVVTGQGLGGGNVEFWGYNYQTANGYGVSGASGSTYDSGDTVDTGGTYGSMQVFRANQTLFAYNGWGTYTADTGSQGSDDVGIGNQATGQPDWTFAANSFRYSYKRLYVLVRQLFPPAASPLTATRNAGIPTWKIAVTDLATNWSVGGGYSISLVSVANSTNGAAVSISGGYILYSNNNTLDDQFSYVITSSQGVTATGIVNLRINPGSVFGQTSPAISTVGGTPTLTFAAIPGLSYSVARTTNMENPNSWTVVWTTNAPSSGVFHYADPSPPQPTAFYRLQWNP